MTDTAGVNFDEDFTLLRLVDWDFLDSPRRAGLLDDHGTTRFGNAGSHFGDCLG